VVLVFVSCGFVYVRVRVRGKRLDSATIFCTYMRQYRNSLFKYHKICGPINTNGQVEFMRKLINWSSAQLPVGSLFHFLSLRDLSTPLRARTPPTAHGTPTHYRLIEIEKSPTFPPTSKFTSTHPPSPSFLGDSQHPVTSPVNLH
jgi:hypothetical protein